MENTKFENETFEEMLEQNLNTNETTKGKIVKGTIIRVDNSDVFIDLGLKSEGIIPLSDFQNKEGEIDLEIGKEVEVLIETSNGTSLPRASKKKADYLKERKKLEEIFKQDGNITFRVLKKVKGGLICDIGNESEITAFLPNSQIDTKKVQNPESLIGETLTGQIIQWNNRSIVISRRKLLEEELEKRRKETLSNLREGDIVEGTVENIIEKGVFVDIGGVTGFVPVSELSWGRVRHPAEMLSQGQEVKVKVKKIEGEGERITLSIKETQPDPWTTAKEKYVPGKKLTGKVTSVTDFGVFVELEPGIEGLVHISELSWTKNFRHPKEIAKTDAIMEVVVLDVNTEERKISLSAKRIEPSPWEQFAQNVSTGTKINGVIKNINEYGVFVEVDEGVVGLVKPENLSWKGRVDPKEFFDKSKIGSEIEVAVLNIDPENRKVSLGIKQLTQDPWEQIRKNLKPRESRIKGIVKEIKPNGIIINVDEEIEGFIPSSEIHRTGSPASESHNPGDEVEALVIGFDRRKRQVTLSIKRLQEKLERERVSEFISSQKEPSTKLGDLLGEQLKSLKN